MFQMFALTPVQWPHTGQRFIEICVDYTKVIYEPEPRCVLIFYLEDEVRPSHKYTSVKDGGRRGAEGLLLLSW